MTPTETRLRLLATGYFPLPLFGKRPAFDKWSQKFDTNPDEIRMWTKQWGAATNTGFLCRYVPTFDADILHPEAIEAIRELVVARFADHGCVLTRVGKPPKFATPFRTDKPFKKISALFADTDEKIEFLCDGQQVVVDGIHPDTHKPYGWHGGVPGEIPRDDLPYISVEAAQQLINDAAELIAQFGFKRIGNQKKSQANGGDTDGAEWSDLIANIMAGRDLHDSIVRLAAKYIASGMSDAAAINVIRGHMDAAPESVIRDERWNERYKDIPRTVSYTRDTAKESKTSDGKRVIKVERGKEYLAWRETQRALIESGCQVFVRSGHLVEPLWRIEKGAETDKPVLAMSLVKYNRERMTDQVARNAAEFVRYDANAKKEVNIDPPRGVIETLLERQDWDFPTIAGVINTPTMRPDGSLLTQQGYDPTTQLWHKSEPDAALPPIPDAPTKSDAERSLEFLKDLLSEFPFVEDLDRSVALAGIMTPVLRGAFPVAPLFFIAKHEAGTGASYFVRLVGTIATGQDATPLLASSDPKELQKELSAKAFEGRPILNLNNLTFDLESAMLCQMLTEGVVDVRPFGKNDQTFSCDCRGMTVFANGNNIRLVGDLVRRAVTCRMDAKQEQPELRAFRHDPIEIVKKNRGAYLAAVFTIARAFITAGSPNVSATELAGFDGWSQRVRHPLMWLGLSDPTKSMDETRALDPERGELRELINALAECFGAAEFTAAEVLGRASISNNGVLAHPELIAVLSRDGRNINTKAIGNQLMKHRGRVSGGYSIEVVNPGSAHHAKKYRIDGAKETKM